MLADLSETTRRISIALRRGWVSVRTWTLARVTGRDSQAESNGSTGQQSLSETQLTTEESNASSCMVPLFPSDAKFAESVVRGMQIERLQPYPVMPQTAHPVTNTPRSVLERVDEE